MSATISVTVTTYSRPGSMGVGATMVNSKGHGVCGWRGRTVPDVDHPLACRETDPTAGEITSQREPARNCYGNFPSVTHCLNLSTSFLCQRPSHGIDPSSRRLRMLSAESRTSL